ncbi:MAG: serine/threonine-protein phosphatase [Lachnospiraceae bacterium]|nr:serine/threonine-protein phosphatase [Lachnospiraceae bacterium]MBQ9609395.1 serine/threonine-protein phosphatase [Lachnospiraceae bacterium]
MGDMHTKRRKVSKKKKLEKRLIALVVIMMLFLSVLLLSGATILNWIVNKNFYNDKTLQIAGTASEMTDEVYLMQLYEAVSTDEFADISRKARESENFELIKNWLDEKGMLDGFNHEIDKLNMLWDNMSAEYIYIQVIKDGNCITLLDPDNPYNSLGVVEGLEGGAFEKISGNVEVEPIRSKTKYGWLSTGGEPVYSESGEAFAIAFCDLDVTNMVKTTIRFVIIDAVISITMLAIVVAVMSVNIKKSVTSPIEQLTDAVDSFGTNEEEYTKDKIVTLDIHTGDEIEELYNATRFMQGSLIDYMDNLTAVTAEKERIGAELDVATRIQASMLPRIYPAFPDRDEFDIYASMDPAKEVGGDFYDYFLIDEDHLGLVVADVSGKGIPASLFMMMSKIIISNYAQMGLSPAEVLEKTNDSICDGNDEDMFVTVWFGILEISTGHVVAGNAGHEYPMIRGKNGDFTVFEDSHDFVIGGMACMPYSQYEFDIEKGGTLFLYTDGCPEATDAHDELFGMERMLEALNKEPDAEPKKLLENMRSAVDEFVGEAPQFDDLTMMAVKLY